MKRSSERPHRVQSSKLSCSLGFSYQRGGVFHKALGKQSCSSYGMLSFWCFLSLPACALFPAFSHGDKWEGVLLVGDSSTQWELSAVTTSVCLRYGLFVVLPTTNSFIITHKKYGAGKKKKEEKCVCMCDTTSLLFLSIGIKCIWIWLFFFSSSPPSVMN